MLQLHLVIVCTLLSELDVVCLRVEHGFAHRLVSARQSIVHVTTPIG